MVTPVIKALPTSVIIVPSLPWGWTCVTMEMTMCYDGVEHAWFLGWSQAICYSVLSSSSYRESHRDVIQQRLAMILQILGNLDNKPVSFQFKLCFQDNYPGYGILRQYIWRNCRQDDQKTTENDSDKELLHDSLLLPFTCILRPSNLSSLWCLSSQTVW